MSDIDNWEDLEKFDVEEIKVKRDDKFSTFEKQSENIQTIQELKIEEPQVQKPETVTQSKKKSFLEKFNESLKKKKSQIEIFTESLPIFLQKNEILKQIQNNQITIIQGNTGCGKSTQVCKYLYQQQNTCKIICTQPTRIAAISLAQRVSDELNSKVGETAGYIIKDENRSSQNTHILFVTTGIFLKKLTLSYQDLFQEYQYIIFDEVHERGIETDFTMIALKHFLAHGVMPKTKLILMSATINTKQFSQYFSLGELQQLKYQLQDEESLLKKFLIDEYQIKRKQLYQFNEEDRKKRRRRLPSPDIQLDLQDSDLITTQEYVKMIKVKERNVFKTYEYFLDTNMDRPWIIQDPHISEEKIFKFPKEEFPVKKLKFRQEARLQYMQIEISLFIIKKILTNETTTENASLLIFLPGMNEIKTYKNHMLSQLSGQIHRCEIIELHSQLWNPDTNKYVMGKILNKIKIILATNIAESSITIPDIKYVIDFCLTRLYNDDQKIEQLILCWASKASLLQRKGRVGRVNNGYVFKMITKEFYDKLEDFNQPEILRLSLEKIVLKIKIMDSDKEEYKSSEVKYEKLEEDDDIPKNEYRGDVVNKQGLRIFKDPFLVLSRAIDKPATEKIGLAILNLQKMGGINIIKLHPHQENTTFDMNITQLGRYYDQMPCDLDLSRLICLASIFKCQEEGFVIASVLCLQKDFFQTHHIRFSEKDSSYYSSQKIIQDIYQFHDVIYNYDKGDKSDLILYIKIYKEWEIEFFTPYQLKRQGRAQENFKISKQFQRDSKQNYNKSEKWSIFNQKIWCDKRFINCYNMIEILILKEDLKARHFGLTGILYKVKYLDLDDPMNILRLKFCITSAFKYQFTSQFRLDSSSRFFQSIFNNQMDRDRSIIIKFNDNELQDYIENNQSTFISTLKENIIEFSHNIDPNIVLGDIICNLDINYIAIEFKQTPLPFAEQIIRKLLSINYYFIYLQKQDRMDILQIQSNENYYNVLQLLIQGGGEFISPNQLKLESLNKNLSQLKQKDIISILTDSICSGNSSDTSNYFITSNVRQIGKKFFPTNLTSLSKEYPMFIVFSALAFSSDIVIYSDEKRLAYRQIVTDDSIITLPNYLLDDDITEINSIRHTIRQMLFTSTAFLYQSQGQDIFQLIFEKLFKNDRSKLIVQEKWVQVLQKQLSRINQNISIVDLPQPKNIFFFQSKKTVQEKCEYINELGYLQEEFQEECEYINELGYLKQLSLPNRSIKTQKVFIFSKVTLMEYELFLEYYNRWKLSIYLQQRHNFLLKIKITQGKSFFGCKKCQDTIHKEDYQFLFQQDYIEPLVPTSSLQPEVDHFICIRVKPWIDAIEIKKELPQGEQFQNDFQDQEQKYNFFYCQKAGHYIGFGNDDGKQSDINCYVWMGDKVLTLILPGLKQLEIEQNVPIKQFVEYQNYQNLYSCGSIFYIMTWIIYETIPRNQIENEQNYLQGYDSENNTSSSSSYDSELQQQAFSQGGNSEISLNCKICNKKLISLASFGDHMVSDSHFENQQIFLPEINQKIQ